MAQVTIDFETRFGAFERGLKSAELWSNDKRQAFISEWQALASAGAEMVEVRTFGTRIVAFPSEELSRHLAKWGLLDWPSA